MTVLSPQELVPDAAQGLEFRGLDTHTAVRQLVLSNLLLEL